MRTPSALEVFLGQLRQSLATANPHLQKVIELSAVKQDGGRIGYLVATAYAVPATKADAEKLRTASVAAAKTWNFFTEVQEECGWQLGYFDIKKLLPGLKAERPWLKQPSSQVLQEVAKAHAASVAGARTKANKGDKAGLAGFKATRNFCTIKYPQNETSFRLDGTRLHLAHGTRPEDWLTLELETEVPLASAIKCVTISFRKKEQRYSVSLETQIPLPKLAENYHILVFDPGSKTLLTGLKSTGEVFEYDISPLRTSNMETYKTIDGLMSERDALPCAQELAAWRKERAAANRFIGPPLGGLVCRPQPKVSKTYRWLNAKIGRLFAKMRGRQKDYLHTLANLILRQHPDVTEFHVGDWQKNKTLANTEYKAKNASINRAMQNNNPIGKLIEYLSYKAAHAARKVAKFDERGSTKTCSHCHHIGPALKPEVRTFKCQRCGVTMERDINAVRNQLRFVNYGLWQALRACSALSIRRYTLNRRLKTSRTRRDARFNLIELSG